MHIRLNCSVFSAAARLVTLPPRIRSIASSSAAAASPPTTAPPFSISLADFPVLRGDFDTIDPNLPIDAVPLGSLPVDSHRAVQGSSVGRDGGDNAPRRLLRVYGWVRIRGRSVERRRGGASRAKHLGAESEHESEVAGAILALHFAADGR